MKILLLSCLRPYNLTTQQFVAQTDDMTVYYWLIDWLTAKLLLALASTVIFDSESHGTVDRILLSEGSGSFKTNDSVHY
jgi:hypothetical protein